ncbi:hypothetical protein GC173_01855 [bacterium]|nr:hypothetical protein [bacterium]
MRPADLRHPWTTALFVLAVLLLFIPALAPIQRSIAVIGHYPWQLDREEGFLLQQALELKAGRTIYPDLDGYPYTVGNYPPVYPAVYTALLATGSPGLWQGRLLVLLAAVSIALMAAWIVWRETGRVAPALLAPMLFLVTWDWNDWIVYTRVDIPAIALGLGGLVVLTGGTRKWRLAVAAALFLLAVYTKQTQILAPVAGIALLVWQGRRRAALALACGLAVAGLIVLGILQWLTGGEFWRHTVTFNANVMEWGKLWTWAGHLGRFSGEKLAVAVLGLAILWRARLEQPTALAFGMWLLLNSLSYIQLAKAGSAANYLLELDVAVAVVAVLAAAMPLPADASRPWRALQVACVVALLVGAGLQWHPVRRVAIHAVPVEQPGDTALWARLVGTDGDVLSELPIYAIRADKPVLYQPFIMQQLAAEGRWDPAPFLADIAAHRFRLIVTTQPMDGSQPTPGWTPEMREAVARSYRPVEAYDSWWCRLWIHEPASPP